MDELFAIMVDENGHQTRIFKYEYDYWMKNVLPFGCILVGIPEEWQK